MKDVNGNNIKQIKIITFYLICHVPYFQATVCFFNLKLSLGKINLFLFFGGDY